jgi:NAD(P)-dependent dehydrogenase (short-subunit alcohol dehydrogenase family)
VNTTGKALAGRTSLVTGASRGIGRAIALALAESGADVAIAARGKQDLERLLTEIEGSGVRALACQCDVAVRDDVNRMAALVEQRFGGPPDILVNNAGAAQSHAFIDHPDELWHRMIEANLTSVYYVTRVFVPAMAARGSGRIITIASTASHVGSPYVAAYTAAKHGVLGLTRALAAELVGKGITVNAICPGYVDTPMTEAAIENIANRTGRSLSEARLALERMSPQKRLITPEEVAAAVVFLALDSSRGINGQSINIDGGAVQR